MQGNSNSQQLMMTPIADIFFFKYCLGYAGTGLQTHDFCNVALT
jgi:hypothetical protein